MRISICFNQRKISYWLVCCLGMVVGMSGCQDKGSDPDVVTPTIQSIQCRLTSSTELSKNLNDAQESVGDRYEYRYGVGNRLESIVNTLKGGGVYTTTFEYDTNGFVVSLKEATTDKGVVTTVYTAVVSYTNGRLSKLLFDNGQVFLFAYDTQSKLSSYSFLYPNVSYKEEYGFTNGVLTKYVQTNSRGTTTATIANGRVTELGSIRYSYDSKGRLVKKENVGGVSPGYTTYEYDDFVARDPAGLPNQQLKGWSEFQNFGLTGNPDYAVRKETAYSSNGTLNQYASYIYLNKANAQGYLTEQINFRGTDPATNLNTVSYTKATYDFVGCQ